ncbi:MAG: hypothetical protein H7A48_06195 [Akkermansiaceae bacterium]|nr:hypothetical protein [Akkermansiaceae bacterium]
MNCVAMDESGRIFAGGSYSQNTFALAKLLPNGALDDSFGTGGVVYPQSGTAVSIRHMTPV